MQNYKTDIKYSYLSDDSNLLVNGAGDFIFLNNYNLQKFWKKKFNNKELNWLQDAGIIRKEKDDFYATSYAFKSALRNNAPKKLNYLIIIPTLRCNLTCSYCQVSRANEQAKGYDWTKETLKNFINFVDIYANEDVKIEFQGGEPSLRLDIVTQIVDEIKKIKPKASFVICTNLSNLSKDFLNLVERDYFFISSSLDGPPEIHESRRTFNKKNTTKFFDNLDFILKVRLKNELEWDNDKLIFRLSSENSDAYSIIKQISSHNFEWYDAYIPFNIVDERKYLEIGESERMTLKFIKP